MSSGQGMKPGLAGTSIRVPCDARIGSRISGSPAAGLVAAEGQVQVQCDEMTSARGDLPLKEDCPASLVQSYDKK